jgi:hypothetical protein
MADIGQQQTQTQDTNISRIHLILLATRITRIFTQRMDILLRTILPELTCIKMKRGFMLTLTHESAIRLIFET